MKITALACPSPECEHFEKLRIRYHGLTCDSCKSILRSMYWVVDVAEKGWEEPKSCSQCYHYKANESACIASPPMPGLGYPRTEPTFSCSKFDLK